MVPWAPHSFSYPRSYLTPETSPGQGRKYRGCRVESRFLRCPSSHPLDSCWSVNYGDPRPVYYSTSVLGSPDKRQVRREEEP